MQEAKAEDCNSSHIVLERASGTLCFVGSNPTPTTKKSQSHSGLNIFSYVLQLPALYPLRCHAKEAENVGKRTDCDFIC